MNRPRWRTIQTFGPVDVQSKRGAHPRAVLDTRYRVTVDGRAWPHISSFGNETDARTFALGLAQGFGHDENGTPRG